MGYQLRYAAGRYWLLDIDQEGVPYKKPLSLNEVGADIWNMIQQGFAKEEIVEALCREYHVEKDMVEDDVEQFLEMLAKRQRGEQG
ncbi:MAG: PqqD family protein [Candidatus Gastranaerophilales bacterium]|nr:PqqD family protein [Candidatus Gastranaerophilales bacterium]